MSGDPYKYFRIEAREILDGLSQGALELEKGAPGTDLVKRLLRLAHTLKGAARVVKQQEIADLAHAIEDGLAPYREGAKATSRLFVEELLRLVDKIAAKLSALDTPAENRTEPARDAAHEDRIETVRIEVTELESILEGASEAGIQIGDARSEIDSLARAQQLIEGILGQIRTVARAGQNGVAAPSWTARVGSGAEELHSILGTAQRGLGVAIEQADREMRQVRDAANRLRLLPAAALFSPLQRVARDTAQVMAKNVDFRASGGEERLDAHVLSPLRSALLQIVRNAIAHGIETERERVKAGKPAAGSVELKVTRRGNRVAFSCADDGRGIDLEAVRRVVAQRGLAPTGHTGRLELDDLIQLMLRGGVTTSGQATEISGRGIGLDVVREAVQRVKGEVRVRSEPGRGTTFEIVVPFSLSSIPCLLLAAGNITAAIPLDSIERTQWVNREQLARSGNSASLSFEGQTIPFVPLERVVGTGATAAWSRSSWSTVIMHVNNRTAAFGADRLLGSANVTLKPLPPWVGVDPIILGTSTGLGGTPTLVLDPAALVTASGISGAAEEHHAAQPPPVLVIDDSLTTRMLEQSILESAGFPVDLAVSGEEALAKARQRRYSLFVVDVEMPGMDGFGFLSALRTEPTLSQVPSILVTSRNSPEDRRRGMELGARAYIVKSEFDQQRLLATIRELVRGRP